MRVDPQALEIALVSFSKQSPPSLYHLFFVYFVVSDKDKTP
jgi:hypothetical protein